MPKMNFDEWMHSQPILEAKDLGSSTTQTDVFSLRDHFQEVRISVGTITGNATIKVYGCTDVNKTGATAVATWWYRKTSAVGTDSHGATAAGSAAGITMTATTDNNKMLIIYIDPDQFAEASFNYAYVEIAPGTVFLCSAVVQAMMRNPSNSAISLVV